MSVVKHWQHENLGTLQHSAFGVAVFLGATASQSSIWEIEAPADKRVQLIFTFCTGSVEQRVEVGASSHLTTTNRTYAATEIAQYGPAPLGATFRRGYSTTDLFGTSRAFHLPLRGAADSRRADILSAIPIVANPGEFITIYSAVNTQTTGDVAWVEF